MSNVHELRQKVLERRQRRFEVARVMIRDNLSPRQVAEKYGVNLRTIHRDLDWVEEEWKQASIRLAKKAKDKITAGLQEAIAEAWKGWERSQEDAETRTVKEYEGEGGVPLQEKTLTRKGQAGDPTFLKVVTDTYWKLAELYDVTSLQERGMSSAAIIELMMRIEEEGKLRLDDRPQVIEGDYVDKIADTAIELVEKNGEPDDNGQPED